MRFLEYMVEDNEKQIEDAETANLVARAPQRAGWILPVAGAGLLALAGVAYSLWPRSQVANDEFLRVYDNALKIQNNRLVTWINGEVDNLSLEEQIVMKGFLPYKTNVPSLDQADIIILGDMHTYMNEAIDGILPYLVNVQDKVLIESSPERWGDPLDLVTFAKRPWEVQEDLMDRLSPYNGGSWGSSLIIARKGNIVPVDASKELKQKRMFTSVRGLALSAAYKQLENGEDLNPFLDWMIYEDLQLTSREQENVQEVILNYINSLPSLENLMQERQRALIDNILREVRDTKQGQKCVLVIGNMHFNGFGDLSLKNILEKNRIGYAAFEPDVEWAKESKDALEDKPLKYTSQLTPEEREEISIRYFIEDLIRDWYVKDRVAEGASPFRGSYAGLREALLLLGD